MYSPNLPTKKGSLGSKFVYLNGQHHLAIHTHLRVIEIQSSIPVVAAVGYVVVWSVVVVADSVVVVVVVAVVADSVVVVVVVMFVADSVVVVADSVVVVAAIVVDVVAWLQMSAGSEGNVANPVVAGKQPALQAGLGPLRPSHAIRAEG